MKNLLLFTSEKVEDTGSVSFSYIFQIDGAYDKYPKHCRSNYFGYAWPNRSGDESVIPFNMFTGGRGMVCGGAFGQGQEDLIVESLPEYGTMLCTKEIGEKIKVLLSGKVSVEEIFSEETLLTNG